MNLSTATNNRLIVVIAGPTGVGKSDVAARLCKSRKGMIVSADSVQVFRGVQIGANKPSAEEMKETPHLLVDVVGASETYNAAEWQRDALFSIQYLLQENPHPSTQRQEEIASHVASARLNKEYGKEEPLLPVVVGGTMMYLHWLVHGRPDAVRPSEDTVKRATEIMDRYQSKADWEEAVSFVASFGETFATRTHQLCGQDWYRLRRTLEIAYTVVERGGDALLERLYSGEREGGLESYGYDVRCFFLCPNDRMKHTEVVDRRCEDMVVRGLLKETTDLHLSDQLPDMAARAIGYRQTLDYLERDNFAQHDGDALNAYLNDFTTATRRYAKKQMQWFRKDGSFAFVPVPVSQVKQDRVNQAAEAIERMCSMDRSEYEKELSSENKDGNVSVSEQTKRVNEEQGKKMKFYNFQRHLITSDSEAFRDALEQADECTRRIQGRSVSQEL
jgi:tRNA dimethylallyltransferase